MNKAIVIGCPGSGKTTFSIELSELTHLPLIHLDFAHHQPIWDIDPVMRKKQWQNHLERILQSEQWIIDGNYKSTIEMRAEVADTVIFFDYPRWFCFFRALKRRWKHRKEQRPDMPETWHEKFSWELLSSIMPSTMACHKENSSNKDGFSCLSVLLSRNSSFVIT